MGKRAFEELTQSMYYVLMGFLTHEMCGTDIVNFVTERTKGRVKIGPGTLYTILARFEEEELIVETAVLGRKRTYRMTDKGRALYQVELERLRMCVLDGTPEEKEATT